MRVAWREYSDRLPLTIMLSGLLSSALGVATLYVFPESRFKGLSATSVVQGVVIFGGMLAMMVGAHMMHAESAEEQASKLREGVRFSIVLVATLMISYGLSLPFAIPIAFFATAPLSHLLQRACAWIGKL